MAGQKAEAQIRLDWKTIARVCTASTDNSAEQDSIAEARMAERVNARKLLMTMPAVEAPLHTPNYVYAPRVFKGYRHISKKFGDGKITDKEKARIWRKIHQDEVAKQQLAADSSLLAMYGIFTPVALAPDVPARDELPVAFGKAMPPSLERAIAYNRLQEEIQYRYMITHPAAIEFAYWQLPLPPTLPEEDYSFKGFLERMQLPEVNVNAAVIRNTEVQPINWLHNFNIALQLSQAYLSPNWYQGGNDYLSFLGNFLWDVQLNQVYHPKWMFQSTVSYKLALNSTKDDLYHKYSISQDLFQYNFKTGYKAFVNWFYTFSLQFKTQFLNNYAANSMVRTASFLSPGELNLGLGMTYSKSNEKKTVVFTAMVSPISYNLKTCIDAEVEHSQFNIPPDARYVNEIGSNAEVNFSWKLRDNISYTTRLFLFSDYKSFTGDWENTLNFQFSRFFSTQIYAHLRYDSNANQALDPRWKKWMLKEILSVGLSYSFSTK